MAEIVYSNPVDVVSFNIIGVFDSFREHSHYRNQEGNLQIVLLFISLYKDDIINDSTFQDGFSVVNLKALIDKSPLNEVNKKAYFSIIEVMDDSLSRFLDKPLSYFSYLFSQIQKDLLTIHFSDVIDDIIYRFSKAQGRIGGVFLQPLELTGLMVSLADLKTDDNVYNPFAGAASFGVQLNQKQNYLGQELDPSSWVLGMLRLMAHNKLSESKFVCNDSILKWPDNLKKFNLIISSPPFRLRLGNQYQDVETNSRTVEQFLIEKGIQSLNENGKLITLLPQGFLFTGGSEQRLRENLIKEDLIDTIISLPSGLLINTSISSIILVLNKAKKLSGKIKFIDAQKFIITKGSRERILDEYSLKNFINSDEQDRDVIRIVSNEQIRDNGYNLSVARYFQNHVEGVKLGDILELIRGQRGNLPESGKLVKVRDLKDDQVDFNLNISKVEKNELKRPDIHLISESCLLISLRWHTLKPTFFEFEGEPIFRSHDILSFKVDESIADKAYLINELHSDYVKEQLESYRLGASSMPFIRREDLMNIIIKLPSLKEQRAKVQGIHEISEKINTLQEERNALIYGKTLKEFNEFASLKHTLGRPRQNILDWSDNLLDFLVMKKDDFEALNKDFSEFYDIDVISALKEIKRDINFITDVLEKGENGLVLSEYEKHIIPLTDINSIINELSNNGFNFKLNKLLLKGEKLKDRGIYAHKILFKTLLDNILTNANKYAFDKKLPGNEVIIELTEVDDYLSMEIRNNGKPFPKNFDKEKFITKYSTANSSNGSGLGGYDIHRIATDFHNPEWILELNEDPFFLVKFKFQFPIKPTN